MKYYTNVAKWGNQICYRYIDNGERYIEKVKFQPTLYHLTKQDSEYKTLNGHNLKPYTYESIKDMKAAVDYSTEIDYVKLFGSKNVVTQFIQETYPDGINYNAEMKKQIRGFFLDIEVHCEKGFPVPIKAEWPVVAISVYDTITETFFVLGYHPNQTFKFDPQHEKIGHLNVKYKQCASEYELLTTFLNFWDAMKPDWYSGWNSDNFDMAYMYNRIEKILGEYALPKLSPFRFINSRMKRGEYSQEQIINIIGVEALDYLELYKKHTYKKLPSYKLDYVAYAELKEKKLSYKESGNLKNLYIENFQKYIEYNIQDTNLVLRLDKKLDFINVTYSIAYYALINYNDTLDTVPAWESMPYHRLIKKNIIPPINPVKKKSNQFTGAYVHDPKTGFYDWVVLVDLASMYPHIIQQWNIGTESLIEYNEKSEVYDKLGLVTEEKLLNKEINTDVLPDNVCLGANGCLFDTSERTFFHEIMRELYDGRKVNKRKQTDYEKGLEEIEDEIKRRGI